MSHMNPGITSVRAVPCELLPSPASSSVSSSCSMYPSINFSFFHRANRSRIAADSGGSPRIAETSLICTSCSWSISEGVKTLNLTSYGFRFCVRRSLSSEKPVSKSLKSMLVAKERVRSAILGHHPFPPILKTRDHVDHDRVLFFVSNAPSPKLSSSLPCVSRKSSGLDTSLIKSSSESMLPAVVAGVAIRLFFGFKLASLVELPLSVSWEVTVTEEVCSERDLGSDAAAVAFPPWTALVAALGEDWSLSAIAASAAFLFRVRRGVVKRGVRQRCRQWWGKGGFMKVGGDRGAGGSRPRDRGSLV